MDLRLNENKIRSVHYSSLSRFGNLTYLNLTKNDISYVEDGAFSAQFNLQVSAHPPSTSGVFQVERRRLAASAAYGGIMLEPPMPSNGPTKVY